MLGASARFRHQVTGSWAPTNVTYHLSESRRTAPPSTARTSTPVPGGAMATRDGLDLGGQIHALASRWANVERHEAGFPYRYLYRRLVTDSGGPGKFRGGMCHEYAVVPHGNAGSGRGRAHARPRARAPSARRLRRLSRLQHRVDPIPRVEQGRLAPDLASTSGKQSDRLEMGITELGDADVLYIRHDGAGRLRRPARARSRGRARRRPRRAGQRTGRPLGLRRRPGFRRAAGRPRRHRRAEARGYERSASVAADCPIRRHPPAGGPGPSA